MALPLTVATFCAKAGTAMTQAAASMTMRFMNILLLSIWEPGHLAQAHESDRGSNLANDDTPAYGAPRRRALQSKAPRCARDNGRRRFYCLRGRHANASRPECPK